MQTEVIYWSLTGMTLLSSSIIFFFLIWNKKNIDSTEKIQRLELTKQRDILIASITAQEEERKRLAENLHDDVGPLLSAINIQLGSIDVENEKLEFIKATLIDAIKSVRTVSLRLSPAILTELGLNQAFEQLCRRFIKYSEIKLNKEWDKSVMNLLSKNEQINIYRIVQEIMNNTIKHSSAKLFILKCRVDKLNDISLVMKDDGIGFNQNLLQSKESLGLKNIKARVEAIKGELIITSNNFGTKVQIILKHSRND